ncbi:hypothetical protein [Chenggangzhangella methanolivorans]|uniref:Tat pathway signal sequence domain protein n=1 Tax=Chenggangzhangella methanolivorans TaxID=1437009 RepID=A0A9E6RHM1_9HYPH|nr:hypothetical protein [Chenggangzhangella methanolivorans]QZO01596.1 hypothetical protein K6K41_09430 [Chenggangzhangella methanolivorans]
MSPFVSSRAALSALAGFAALTLGVPATAASGVSVELNRLEPKDSGCQISIVVANAADKALDSLKLDLVFFDKDGVISRRLAVEAGPVRASKTSVKLFNAAETKCDGIGRVLLNDVTACGGAEDCLAAVSTSSRVKDVEFAK